ncbi:MAG: hypothetical protein ABL949_14710 [Fimbriimonadaceae bacterium]
MSTMKTWNGVIAGAAIVMLGTCIYHFIAETPMARIQAKKVELSKLQQENSKLFSSVSKLKKANGPRIWATSSETIGPSAMGKLTELARGLGLTLLSFRPQKPEDSGELEKFRYVISLEGSFPRVIEFARKAETPENRIAVDRIQIASKDGATDSVSATIGVVAYRDKIQSKAPDPKAALASDTKTKP